MPLPYFRLSAFYFAYFALLGATVPFLPLYFHHLGFSSVQIGELLAIPMLTRCFAPNLWGWLGDRTGQRLRIVRIGAVLTLLCFSSIFLGSSYGWLALVMASHAFFWHAVLPQFEVITLGHLREQAARYSQIRLWGSIGFILTVIGMGALFERVSIAWYPWVVIAVMASIILSSWLVPDSAPASDAGTPDDSRFLARLREPMLLAFFSASVLMQFSHGPYYSFITLYLEQLGYSRTIVGWIWALGVIAEVVLFMLMARVLARWTVRQVLITSLLLASLRWLLLGQLADVWPVLLLAQLLHAATFGSFHAASIHFIRHHFGPQQQGQAQALYAAVWGIGGAIGALYAGHAWHHLGPGWSFGLVSLATLLAAGVLWRGLREPVAGR